MAIDQVLVLVLSQVGYLGACLVPVGVRGFQTHGMPMLVLGEAVHQLGLRRDQIRIKIRVFTR